MAKDVDLSAVPLRALIRETLVRLGEDPERQGLLKTPERVESSLTWLTRGHGMEVRQVLGDALFDEDHHNMVIVKDIEMYSLCEHHMLPFFGKVHVAYIPNGRIVGLSKVPRIVEFVDALPKSGSGKVMWRTLQEAQAKAS